MFDLETCKLPKPKKTKAKRKLNLFVVAADIYARKYKQLYGRVPSFEFNNEFVSIDGKDGVTIKRLCELTKQLAQQIQSRSE